jgi:hypothetical protein
MVTLLVAVLVLFGTGVAAAIALLLRTIAAPTQQVPVTLDWIDELSMERYRPMLRLLTTEDLEFLRSQPGVTPAMVGQLRRDRCRIFRAYLRTLQDDFRVICAALKLLLVQASTDRPDLAGILLRSQLTFAGGMLMVHARVTIYACGIGTVDVAGLLRVFDSMRVELRTLVPITMTAGA